LVDRLGILFIGARFFFAPHAAAAAYGVIPLIDAAIVLRHSGTQLVTFRIHGVIAVIMLITCGFVAVGPRLKAGSRN